MHMLGPAAAAEYTPWLISTALLSCVPGSIKMLSTTEPSAFHCQPTTHLLLRCLGRSVSFKNVVASSMRSLYAERCESSLATMLAMRPTTKLKKKPLTIIVMMAQIFSARVVLLMSP